MAAVGVILCESCWAALLPTPRNDVDHAFERLTPYTMPAAPSVYSAVSNGSDSYFAFAPDDHM
jgi:hypothetical protein